MKKSRNFELKKVPYYGAAIIKQVVAQT